MIVNVHAYMYILLNINKLINIYQCTHAYNQGCQRRIELCLQECDQCLINLYANQK